MVSQNPTLLLNWMKIAFVTNIPSHFHTRLFETMAEYYDVDFLFFSDGSESWIQRDNELKFGKYKGVYVRGIRLTSSWRINLDLISKLIKGNYDVFIHSINGRFELIATFVLSKVLRKPFILWTNLWFHPRTLFHEISFPVTKFIYRHANAIVVYGYHVRDYLVALGVDEKKIFYSWNVVDNDFFSQEMPGQLLQNLKTTYHLQGRQVILYVGRLAEEKGLIYLLQAYKELPAGLNVGLLLIGQGREKEKLMRCIKEYQIQGVYFAGYVPTHELPPYYALADILVLPSITTRTLKEVWGVVLNEAMNQGCPVITTDAVGAAVGGLIQEGKNGIIVPERDSKALCNAIARMLSDQNKLMDMREYTRKFIKNWDHHKSFKGFEMAIQYVTQRVD